MDVTLGIALLLLFALAPAAQLVARAEPEMPDPDVPYAKAHPSREAPPVRALPVGMPDGLEVRTPEDLRPLASAEPRQPG